MSRGRHHTYCTELQTDTTSCSGFTVAAKGQRGKEYEVCGGKKCGTERCKEKMKRERERKSGSENGKREEKRGCRRWHEGSMKIAQDLTGIFLDS